MNKSLYGKLIVLLVLLSLSTLAVYFVVHVLVTKLSWVYLIGSPILTLLAIATAVLALFLALAPIVVYGQNREKRKTS